MDEGLRRQYLAAMGIPLWLPKDAAEQEVPPAPLPVDPTPAPERKHQIPPTPEPTSGPKAEKPIEPTPPPPAPPAPGLTDIQSPPISDLDSLSWDQLQARIRDCTACPQLVQNRTQTVFGVGNRQADLMVIGEAPGADEDRQGEPFVGRAGQLLNKMLIAMGFPRDTVFIANILKCRPPNNRDPHVDEAARCESYLLRQLELLKPKLILSVGRISAQNLLKTDAPVGRLRGKPHYFGEKQIPVVVTYHPAYLLRSPLEKAKAWSDLQLALRVLKDTN